MLKHHILLSTTLIVCILIIIIIGLVAKSIHDETVAANMISKDVVPINAVPGSLPFDFVYSYTRATACASIYQNLNYQCKKYCNNDTSLILAYTEDGDFIKARAIVSRNDAIKTVFASYMETNSTEDILNDAYVVLQKPIWNNVDLTFIANNPKPEYENIQVHLGFQNIYIRSRNAVFENIYSQLSDPKYQDYDLIFAGYSLGGALASIAAVDYHHTFGNRNKMSLYTFGQPRTGNFQYSLLVNSLPFADRIYRVTRKGDPVVHLPTIGAFFHTKQQYQIQDDRSIVKCENVLDGTGESLYCDDDFPFGLNPLLHKDYYGEYISC